ncbi:molybdate ABC transporter ATP-binding protein ModF [Vibrio sp. SCSIO 43136]|uniref:molybdate ABC transporter ATP-binding protein ModF n=1 Tax=Vibrio sp. SCSIO 43136 TaxID=2819101 RepID=UPI00207611A7|nr:molybdate ABC transporter ATP-binding protein ModF [Vibrio sp. SCSIO 43136]USD67978.1 molybdate ABC transporter ATP-binding protein ModF [Vibrio sp. SCSIO 43136]
MEITFEEILVKRPHTTLNIPHWRIPTDQCIGVFNGDGDVGTLLGDLLCGEILPDSGQFELSGRKVAQVSLTEQQRLLEMEIANDDTDFLDRIDTGSSVLSLILNVCQDESSANALMQGLDITHLAHSGFRVLSTGETRRVMLARALGSEPDVIVLENPFTGLDVEHHAALSSLLSQLSKTTQLIVVFNREEDIPDWIDQIALFNHGTMDSVLSKQDWDSHPIIAQLKAQSAQQSEQMLDLIRSAQYQSPFENPIFELNNGKVAYTDKTIFSDVNWRIDKGVHWQVKGPNGCGKSTLLGLIFGDHPQCYSNDIHIFGNKRGSGETIWEIKQHIGMVSSALHLQYRVNCSALHVILSGFFDSIGLYDQPSKKQVQLAEEWLEILHMTQFAKTPFKALEYGQQRLLLIARAIVKQPTLLILDEPYQGLDYLGRRLVKSALEMIAKEKLCQLLYVSHYQADSLDSIQHFLEFEYNPDKACYHANVVIKEPI